MRPTILHEIEHAPAAHDLQGVIFVTGILIGSVSATHDNYADNHLLQNELQEFLAIHRKVAPRYKSSKLLPATGQNAYDRPLGR
jgi:hypothetical protein